LAELRFNVSLDINQVILDMLFPANFLASTGKKTKSKPVETTTENKP